MNYNLDKNELEKTLRNFYAHLKDGGIIIFDFVPRKQFEEKIDKVSIAIVNEKDIKLVGFTQLVKTQENVAKGIMVFLWRKNDKINFEIDEHLHGFFEIRDVERLMRKSGFSKVRIFENFEFKKYSSKSKRAVFVGFKIKP
jgi:hypothetical protein